MGGGICCSAPQYGRGWGGGEEGHTQEHAQEERTRKCCTYPLATYPLKSARTPPPAPRQTSLPKTILTCFHASFFPFCPPCWPPLFLPFSRYLFAPFFSPSKSALFCRAKCTAQSSERGRFRKNMSTKFGKEIPSRNLRPPPPQIGKVQRAYPQRA